MMENIVQNEKKSILVVEDEDSLRQAMSLVFRSNGYKVFQAANGTEAFEIVQREKLDLVVSDVRMPNGDGIGLLQKIRELHFERPVLFLVTGFTDLKTEDAFDMGADAIFPKPFDRELLLQTIKQKLLLPDERWADTDAAASEIPLKVQLKVSSLDPEINGSVLRIGRGGFFVALDKDFPSNGSDVKFSLESLSEPIEIFEGIGTVRWVRHRSQENLPAGCGIEFKIINSPALTKMIEYIDAQKLKALIPKT